MVMFFELINVFISFQFFINNTLRVFLRFFCTTYLDDILIYSDTLDEHRIHVRKVINALVKVSLYLKLEKCRFYQQQVKYLGFVISSKGIAMNSAKIKAIIE